jgi:hypothetical protein
MKQKMDEKDRREKFRPGESALSGVGSGKETEATRLNLERWWEKRRRLKRKMRCG